MTVNFLVVLYYNNSSQLWRFLYATSFLYFTFIEHFIPVINKALIKMLFMTEIILLRRRSVVTRYCTVLAPRTRTADYSLSSLAELMCVQLKGCIWCENKHDSCWFCNILAKCFYVSANNIGGGSIIFYGRPSGRPSVQSGPYPGIAPGG